MSTKYSGGFITKSPVAPTTSAASGIWTLDQQQQAQKAGTWPSPPIFIEDLFSTYLYTGTGATQTITNGINLSANGGLVWSKARSTSANHVLSDTANGVSKYLSSDTTSAISSGFGVTAFNTDGFNSPAFAGGSSLVSWTFREQAKFFDVVTWTGTGSAQTISHNLGSTPGCIIVKRTSGTQGWIVYHRSLTSDQYFLQLNLTDAQDNSGQSWAVTDTTFNANSNVGINASGQTFVAYLFAHDAGGFPVSGGGSTNGISCGSFSTDGSGNATVNLGYEPQWLMYKCSNAVGDWEMVDVMRGWVVGVNNDNGLRANSSDAESTGSNRGEPSSTGFNCVSFPTSRDFIYIAIRRGPMKTPTVGTSVFSPVARTANGTYTQINTTFAPDLVWSQARTPSGYTPSSIDRLRGASKVLFQTNTSAEATSTAGFDVNNFNNTGVAVESQGQQSIINYLTVSGINWFFGRAPSFFDEVCYTGNGATQTLTHNLGVAPELMIVKKRSIDGTSNWAVYASPLANANAYLFLNDTAAVNTSSLLWNSTAPTSTVFSLGASTNINQSGQTAVAYLFATCAGVSKVGSYTGTGALLTVNCGFTSGARFVLIKRTDSTGDWFTYDSARGITSSNDPYLLLNSTAAEVTGTNYVDTDTTGFQVTAAAPAGLNANGGTYIFLAIA